MHDPAHRRRNPAARRNSMKKVTKEMKAEVIGGTITEIRPLTKKERAWHSALRNMPKTARVITLNNGHALYADSLIEAFYEF
jgi:hypothetical protein